MAEISSNTSVDTKFNRKRRAKKLSTHIDMTPMVDLMSLLITFFMLTTAFAKPKIMEIVLPDEEGESGQAIASRTINLLLSSDNKIYYYLGKPPMSDKEVTESAGRLQKINYSKNGLRKLLLNRNIALFEKVDSLSKNFISGKTEISQDSLLRLIRSSKKKDKVGPIVMIKADNKAKYRNIVDVIDEMEICNVARYAIVDPSDYELKLLANAAL
jgi:biopolymer transport protein ExbD